jgi:hypothetical protein
MEKVEYNKLYAFRVNHHIIHGLVAGQKGDVVTVWTNQARQIDIDLSQCQEVQPI